MEDSARGHLGEGLGGQCEPICGAQAGARVDAESLVEPAVEGRDPDPVPDRAVGGGHAAEVVALDELEVRGPAVEGAGEAFGEATVELGDAAGVGGGEEDLEARAPLVVGGAGSVEAEHLGAGSDACGGVPDVGEERADGLGVEGARELETGNEHAGIVASGVGCGTFISVSMTH